MNNELKDAWINCIKMWEWIVLHHIDGERDVGVLKSKYLLLEREDPYLGCYFCAYGEDKNRDVMCDNCPARLVDPTFRCDHTNYAYDAEPVAFLVKIKELYAKAQI